MKEEIQKFFKGDVTDEKETLLKYSHDASLFEVIPKLVVSPKDSEDIKNLIKFVNANDQINKISITARSAGTDMSGGPLNESIILDFTHYMNKLIFFDAPNFNITVQPGMYYRDFEKIVAEKKLMLPSFPASKDLCAIGGIVSNNSGGEKSLVYGKTEKYVESLKIVLADGNEYIVKPLTQKELAEKIELNTFEGDLYKKLYQLIMENRQIIEEAKPNVSKNSAGYYIWNVIETDGKFNLCKLIVGSQGTFGMVTGVTFRLVPIKKYSRLLVVFLNDMKILPDLVSTVMKFTPESVESYDDKTLKLAEQFLPDFLKNKNFKQKIKFLWSFWPDLFMFLRSGFPKLVLMIEFTDDNEMEINKKLKNLKTEMDRLHLPNRAARIGADENKYWEIRRDSFNLLRQHVKGKRTAPFIDDVIVRPEFLSEFLPKLNDILKDYPELEYTIAGHAASGNFHIIPLVDMHNPKIPQVILEVSEKVYDLVAKYHGSNTAEHNDGIIRTPYLYKMYNADILEIFKKVKNIFDPKGIFNPGKKIGGDKKYIREHITH